MGCILVEIFTGRTLFGNQSVQTLLAGQIALCGRMPARYLSQGRHAHRFFRNGRKRTQFSLYQTRSVDGGRTWGAPTTIWTGAGVHLCEPGVVRSPDGVRLAMLLRENSRTRNSHVMFSADEGATWTDPVELPRSLTGDRHVGRYGPDGRLLISFRDMAKGSPTRGDWVAWVGAGDSR